MNQQFNSSTGMTPFTHPEFGQVRTMRDEKGEVLFCASDVAKALGYAKPGNAVDTHCNGTLKRGTVTETRGIQELRYIYEPDVYRLIIKSKLPQAEKFEKWVFEEVLPSIRKTGGYQTPEALMSFLTTPEGAIQSLQALNIVHEQKALLEAKIELDKPKVDFAEAIATCDGTILVGELALLLKQNGVDIGRTRMHSWLKENKYFCKAKGLPTQKSMNLGLFVVEEYLVTTATGRTLPSFTVKVTGKGQMYFINKFLNQQEEESSQIHNVGNPTLPLN